MHLRVPVETQQVRKVDLNWTCLFCSHRNGTVRLQTGLISDLLQSVPHESWTYSGTFCWIFSIPLCECNLSPYRVFGMDQNWPVRNRTHGHVRSGRRRSRLVRPFEKNFNLTIIVRPEHWNYKALTINNKIFGPTKVGVVGLALPALHVDGAYWDA